MIVIYETIAHIVAIIVIVSSVLFVSGLIGLIYAIIQYYNDKE